MTTTALDRLLLAIALSSAFAHPLHAQDKQEEPASGHAVTAEDATHLEKLQLAIKLIGENRHDEAIHDTLDPLIADFEAKYADPETRYYCPNTPAETLAYLVGAAAESDRGESKFKQTLAVAPTWAYAYYYKAYALLDLDRVEQAQPFLEKALHLAPMNPMFLSELGHLRRMRTDWEGSLAAYADSLDATATASTDEARKLDQARALRGQGYALIELGRLDEAKAKYRKSLKLDPGSSVAKGELEYLDKLKSKK
ncbi:MAG: tetratricopeptide repeat protein [Pseudoxanthomonas sp.]